MNKEELLNHINTMHVAKEIVQFQGDQELPFYVDLHTRYHLMHTFSSEATTHNHYGEYEDVAYEDKNGTP